MKLSSYLSLLLLVLVLLSSCKKDNSQEHLRKIMFLGHTYDWKYYDEGNKVDYRLEHIDLKTNYRVWLGGDICTETSRDAATMVYLEELFEISHPNSYWALGNHDVRNRQLENITNTTGRPTFYASYWDGLCVIVLNTNLNHDQAQATEDECYLQNEQYQLIKNVTDTISVASHLMVLHHHSLLTDTIHDVDISAYHNYYPNKLFSCDPEGHFGGLVYPKMVEVQNRGIQVVFLGGDFGAKAKEFDYRTSHGIQFLGSGINNTIPPEINVSWVTNYDPDQLLELTYDTEKRTLDWQYLNLNSLFLAKKGVFRE